MTAQSCGWGKASGGHIIAPTGPSRSKTPSKRGAVRLAAPSWIVRRRGPRLLPLMLVVSLAGVRQRQVRDQMR